MSNRRRPTTPKSKHYQSRGRKHDATPEAAAIAEKAAAIAEKAAEAKAEKVK